MKNRMLRSMIAGLLLLAGTANLFAECEGGVCKRGQKSENMEKSEQKAGKKGRHTKKARKQTRMQKRSSGRVRPAKRCSGGSCSWRRVRGGHTQQKHHGKKGKGRKANSKTEPKA